MGCLLSSEKRLVEEKLEVCKGNSVTSFTKIRKSTKMSNGVGEISSQELNNKKHSMNMMEMNGCPQLNINSQQLCGENQISVKLSCTYEKTMDISNLTLGGDFRNVKHENVFPPVQKKCNNCQENNIRGGQKLCPKDFNKHKARVSIIRNSKDRLASNIQCHTKDCQNYQGKACTCSCVQNLAHILALNALDLTAPASDALLKNRKNAWVQLAGHPGSFAPAGANTIWKKRLAKENTETVVYQHLMKDKVKDLVPKFYREVEYNGDFFIEMDDLVQQFTDPNIMDIKMGTRTFQESEVKNPILRKDLYDKMVKLNPSEPTEEENEQKAITKLRYMQFREQGSSTSTLGFRVEAIRLSGQQPTTDLKTVKCKEEVLKTLARFLQRNEVVRKKMIRRLKEIRTKFEVSQFFKEHEVIGSSLLLLYDKDNKAGIWMIDFAKTVTMEGRTLNHRSPWQIGNHEDGYLTGLDNLLQLFEEIDLVKYFPSDSADVSSTNTKDSSAIQSQASNQQTSGHAKNCLLG